jgi:phospholipase A1/A2
LSAARRAVLLLAAGLIAAGSAAHAQSQGVWDRRIDEDARRETFTLTSRKPNYLLVTSMSTPNQAPYQATGESAPLDNGEVKFQLALQTKLADDLLGGNGDLWFGYTQVSFWQVFNGEISAPFRETNYEPEGYVSFLTGYDLFGLKLRTVNLGLVHQSNGRAEPLSRSWNRLFADFQLTRGDFALSFKPWLRIKEDPAEDNNPDIENYLGRYELRLFYGWRGQVFSAMLRNVLDSEQRLNAELSWSFPIARRLRGLVQWYNGYGESLIDYNYNSHRIGVGVLLTDWL